MCATTNEQLKYKEQNNEIIRQNVKLHERINVLESIIEVLQRDNIKYCIEKSKAKKKNRLVRKLKPSMTILRKKEPRKKKSIAEEPKDIIHSKRSTKAVNYVLPSSKSKLRKGDPFTFGNET
ncbi:hypothetical protein HPULCUR_007235 [Helicostylum pulchrum]|uniref:Uncharacterized protein n=1 Tax=Helicostylum pulchrum TaxID=562976 RepID=A0ABP9Y456_9FUNG